MQKKAHMQDLMKKVARQTGFPVAQVKTIIVEFLRVIITELANGRVVYLMSLGKFWLKQVDAQKAWDWRNKKHVQLSERMIPKFSFSHKVYNLIRSEASSLIDEQPDDQPKP